MSTLVDAPARVDGVQLLGAMVGSGYRTPPALVRREDGQVLQLTPLLYAVLLAVDGRRTHAEIAELVGAQLDRKVAEADVRMLIDQQLRPLGLLTHADGSAPEVKRSNPLLSLKPRIAVTDPRTTRRLTDPFRVLFRPALITAVLLVFVAVVGWVFFERGLAASAYDAFERPHLLLLVFVVSVLSGGFHEFGHAAAARYSGAEPGAMGAGLYIVWPAFYTDVTDSYRLPRAGRIRTDLGGLYFNAIVVALTFAWWWWTGWEALLLLVATQVLQMVQQLLPLFRFDGYHLLADLAGVPDVYQRIRPTLVGLLPHRWHMPENQVLTVRARALITLWVLVTVPMMLLMLLALLMAVPRILATAGAVVREDAAAVVRAWEAGNVLDLASGTLQLLGVVLPILACVLILSRVGVRFFRGLTRWGRGSLSRRVVASFVAATVLTGLAWAWWPNPGTYRPIEPGEQGTLTSFLQAPQAALVGAPRPAPGDGLRAAATQTQDQLLSGGPLIATFEEGADLPTEEDPQAAIVLIPSHGVAGDESPSSEPGATPSNATPSTTPDGDTGTSEETWVFPFDQPLPPEDGDNQALAVATDDDSVVYDVAFALVWVEDDEVLNVNEAHAYASCSNCVSVAVAFQVVLIVDDAHVIVPQNLAVAANYDCYRCITAAIASQLVLSVEQVPGEDQLLALGQIWDELLHFAANITSYSVTEIMDHLEAVEAEIVAILAGDTPSTATADPSSSPPAQPSSGPSTSPASPSGAPTTSGSTTSPSGQPSNSGSTSPAPPEPSASPSPSSPTTSSGPTADGSPTEASTTSTEATPTPTASGSP